MMAAKELWKRAIVPRLLSGAGTWIGSTKESKAMCEEIQETFWRMMLELPKVTPKVMVTSETQSLKMKHRIWKEKLLTAKSILQKEGSLANMIYMEQIEMGRLGLAKEVEQICKTIGLVILTKRRLARKI